MRDKIFYISCFGFIFGVFLRSFISLNLYFVFLIIIIAFVLLIFFSFISKDRFGILFSVFILLFSFGILRFDYFNRFTPIDLEKQTGKEVELTGLIINEPDLRENNQKLTVELEKNNKNIDILVSVNFDDYYKYGDKIKFSGKLEKPENFITDQGKEFDYINYLRKDGILYVMQYPKIEIISRGNGNFIKSSLFLAKEKFLNILNSVIKEPESLLMGGLILGEKSSFDQSLRQSFVNTGTIHIVALSGYNVTIVAEWIMKIFAFLPKNISVATGILAIFLFVLMTGGSSTAIRAGIMATLALFARISGRNYDIARILLLTGTTMILINPFLLVYDVSFELSFIATIAVIFLSPKIEKYFLWVTERFGLRDIISVTCAAYLFVLPFILYKMGNLSLVSLPANILILPLIPITMIFGFLTGFVGLIYFILALPLGFISETLLHYELSVINFFSNIPFAAISIPDFPLFFTILIYAYFIYKLFWKSIKSFFD